MSERRKAESLIFDAGEDLENAARKMREAITILNHNEDLRSANEPLIGNLDADSQDVRRFASYYLGDIILGDGINDG